MTDTKDFLSIRDKIQTFQYLLEEETHLPPERLENQLLVIQKELLQDPTLITQLEVEEVGCLVQAMKTLAATPLPPKAKAVSRAKPKTTEPFSLEDFEL